MPNKKKNEDLLPGEEVLTQDNLDLLPGEELANRQGLPDPNQPDITRTGLQKMVEGSDKVLTTPLPENIPIVGGQSASQIATAPQRGFRGLGVGLEKLTEGTNVGSLVPGSGVLPQDLARIIQNAPEALNRAAAAVQPGFQPQEGEKLGAFAGETTGGLPLASALGGTGEAVGAGKVALQMLRNAVGGATLTAINDASEKGHVDVSDMVKTGATNAIFPIIRPASNFIAKALQVGTDIPLSGFTNLSRETLGQFSNDPKVLEKAAGTAESIGTRVENIQKGMIDQMDKVGNQLKKARLKFNIASPLETPIEQVAAEGFPEKKSVQEIAKEFVDLKNGFSKTIPAGSKKVIEESIPIKDRIKRLYELRYTIDQNNVVKDKAGREVQAIADQDIESRYLKGLRGQVNNILDELAPKIQGGNLLRLSDKAYSGARELYDEFIKKFANKDQAIQILMQLYKGGSPDQILGAKGGTVDVLRRLEKDTGEKYLDPLYKEFASHELKNIKGKGGSLLNLLGAPGAVIEAAGTRPTAGILNAIYGTGSIMKRLGELASSPQARSAVLAGTNALENQLRGQQ